MSDTLLCVPGLVRPPVDTSAVSLHLGDFAIFEKIEQTASSETSGDEHFPCPPPEGS